MKKITPFFILLLVSLFFYACNKGDDEGNQSTEHFENLEECLQELEAPLQPDELVTPELTSETDEPQPDGSVCTVKVYDWAPGVSDGLIFDPSTSVIYPGGFLRSGALLTGAYTTVVVPRTPIVISHSANGLSRTIADPSLASIREATFDLSRQASISPANIVANIKQIYGAQHLKLAVNGNYNGLITDLSAQFNFNDSSIKSRFVVEFIQVYYSIDVDAKGNEHDWISSDSEVDLCSKVDHSLIYVASVKYGRCGMLFVESTIDATELYTALNGSFSGLFSSGEVDIEGQYSNVYQNSTFKLLLVGGSPTDGVQSVNSLEGFNNWIVSGGDWSETSPGSPIAYTLRYLDGSIAKVVKSGNFTVRDCVPAPQVEMIEVQPSDITVCPEHIGGDRNFSGNGPDQMAKTRVYVKNNDELWAEINFRVKETEADWTEGYVAENVMLWKAAEHGYNNHGIESILSSDEFAINGFPNSGVIDEDNSIDLYPTNPVSTNLVEQFILMGDTGSTDLPENGNVVDCETVGYSYLTVKFNPVKLKLVLN